MAAPEGGEVAFNSASRFCGLEGIPVRTGPGKDMKKLLIKFPMEAA
jgi:hypothetical protein